MKKIEWNENGWTIIQEADGEAHVLGITCRAEKGVVVEVCTRHGDTEEKKAVVTLNGKEALPMSLADFKKQFQKGTLSFN